MVSFLRLVALAACIIPLFAIPATPEYGFHAKVRNLNTPNYIENSWIVVYRQDITDSQIDTHEKSINSIITKRDQTSRAAHGIKAKWHMKSLRGYHIHSNEDLISLISASPEVEYIERDTRVSALDLNTQDSAPYGLGSISHRSAQGSSQYVYDTSAGKEVTVYIVDTGVYAEHSEFNGRASMGANFVSGSANTDENGHGTHCAGTIGGSTYGVAKNATIVAVKVLNAEGSGSNSGVISGINWVASNAGGSGVLSMSLGGYYSAALNQAVTSTVNSGVSVIVAAGNDNANAALYSPASAQSAVTVGAISSNNAKASFSNYGSVVDVFAPGVNILSAWIGNKTSTNTISGTSMATPHVAGLAAYLIGLENLSSPNAISNRISSLAVNGQISGLPYSTVNRRAYNGAS
ncbi:Subtilisin-like protease 2 [Golovinomyces cichoracearum]|uniref:Subtilisin-like protease 2 n=1 Tax=Golovinomyces cichoracearum TaxID=62708 RepID=A0A420HZ72_9PEZI|nr:Subtilisin-like protease 2 [Golovinomyces cichoracearum]